MKGFFEYLKNLSQGGFPRNVLLLVGSGVVVGVLGLFLVMKLSKPFVLKVCKSLLTNEQGMGRDERSESIEAIQVKPGTISKRIATVGKLSADKSVMIKSEMAGRIKSINFQEGETVEAGDVIIRFEDTDLEAEVKLAEAELEHGKVVYDRVQKVKSLVLGEKFDKAKADFDMAVAKLDVAKVKLAKASIKAPFSGTMGLIEKSEGAYIQAGEDLVMIVDSDPMLIDFKIPEKNLHDIGVGQNAEVKFEGFPNEIFRGTVDAIDATVDPLSHSIAVRASVPNPDGRLRSGLFANISLIVGEKSEALLVPEAALGRRGNIEFIWVVENQKAFQRGVLTGTRENSKVEIIGGVRPDEIVVTSGQIKLSEGTPVKITNMSEATVTLDVNSEKKNGKSKSEDNKEKPEETVTVKEDNPEAAPQGMIKEVPVTPPTENETATPSAAGEKVPEFSSSAPVIPSEQKDKTPASSGAK